MKTSECCLGFCQILRSNKNEIISEWVAKVTVVLDVASEQSKPVLIDHLPEVISNLSDILEYEGQKKLYAQELKKDLGKAHGRQRANYTDYSLEAVVKEYSLLREIIIEKIFKLGSQNLEATQIIHKYIDDGINSAVSEFVKIQTQQFETILVDLKKEKDLRETFVNALTHDLRTPLTSARLSAQLIRKNLNNSDNVFKQVSRIITYVDRIEYMIQDLLDANVIQAGQVLPVQVSECDLKVIAEETISDLQVTYGPRFVLRSPLEIVGMWSKNDLRRIFENLCSNAIKYGADNKLITITLEDNGEIVFIKIRNEGNPIPPKEISFLFGHYQRSKTAIASGQKGWGIGLTLVKGLTEAHGGTVSVESEEGKGTTFTIKLLRENYV